MKRYWYPIIIITGVLFYSCKDIPCDPATAYISLVGFSKAETDTVILKKYTRATNFTTPIETVIIDSNRCYCSFSNDTLDLMTSYGNNEPGLMSKYDYEVILPKPNRVFRLTEITEQELSQKQQIAMDKRLCYNIMKSYKVNGQLISGEYNYYRFHLVK